MANFGDILSSLSIGASQSVRRNSGDSAFEAFTPITGLTISSTTITSGTNNRVLYQASGVVSQSANLTFDGTTLNIGNDTSGISAGLIVKTGTSYPIVIRDGSGANLLYMSSAGDMHITGNITFASGTGVLYGASDVRANFFQDPAVSKGYITTNVAGENFAFYPRNATNIGLVVNSDASQTANLMEWRGLSSRTMAVDKDVNLGIGVTSSLSAALQVRRTTEQVRIEYDASNYLNVTVGSTGIATIDGAGSANAVKFASGVDLGFFGATPVTQRTNIGAVTDSSGGSPGNVIGDPAGGIDTVDIGTLQDNFTCIATRLNAIEQVLQDLGLTS